MSASFAKEMRVATREVHSVSDALVNAKLAFALSDNRVWLDGLVVFYPIFEYIEQHASYIMLPAEYRRRDAFKADIRYYSDLLAQDWRENCENRRPAVAKYIQHLQDLVEEDSRLLWAYVYHLYMGLLSGGQILQKKRRLVAKLNPTSNASSSTDGYCVTTYQEHSVAELKSRMRSLIDEHAQEFDEALKKRLIVESKRVFELNNEIVRSVQGVHRANLMKLGIAASVILVAWVCFQWISSTKN